MSRKVGKIDDDAVQTDLDSHRGSSMYHKLQEGPNYVRILPPLEDLTSPGKYYGLHHQHGMKLEGGFRSFRCLGDKNLWCPMCAMAEHFRKEEDKSSKDAARACFSSAKYFFNALTGVLSDGEITPNEDSGIVILQTSNAVFQKFETIRKGEWGDFTDPDEGFWLNIHGEGTGPARRYPSVTPSRKGWGELPEGVDFEEAHDLTSEALVPTKKTGEMVMIMIDRFGDMLDVDTVLRDSKKRSKSRGR